MRGILSTALMVLAVTAVAAPIAAADELVPTREEYVAKVDPICKANTDTNKPLLRSAKKLGNDKKYKAASSKVAKAAANFTKTLKAIEAVVRPPEDSPRLEKWFKFLRIVQTNLSKVSKALKEENRVRAVHEEIRTERSSNAANNVSFVFGFKYCHLKASG
jgi:hypothetical protein